MLRLKEEFEERMRLKDEEMDKAKESHQQLTGIGIEDLRNRLE